ncbi:hypothetical protein ACH41H_07700 [Streptomyces sp. NPDC020800]|uniref:hypothetical protein n=1 Tax=Streptomyces sp. NPDC020800 TaxID=3365092 RepID=UPI0037AFB2AB
MTSQSTTYRARPWMDSDNARERWLRPDEPRVSPDRNAQLMKLRKGQMEHRLDVLRMRDRAPRLALYGRTINGQPPVRSLAAGRELAEQMGWQVPHGQTFTDCLSVTACEDRHGWARVKESVKQGFTDGVVALTRATISPNLDDYGAELDWFDLHSSFLVLVHAENVVTA